MDATKDTKTGANCSGSDGETGRVLTLTNTGLTTEVVVMVSGAYLHEDTDYTVSHLSSSSTVTFTGRVADEQPIEVVYFE